MWRYVRIWIQIWNPLVHTFQELCLDMLISDHILRYGVPMWRVKYCAPVWYTIAHTQGRVAAPHAKIAWLFYDYVIYKQYKVSRLFLTGTSNWGHITYTTLLAVYWRIVQYTRSGQNPHNSSPLQPLASCMSLVVYVHMRMCVCACAYVRMHMCMCVCA